MRQSLRVSPLPIVAVVTACGWHAAQAQQSQTVLEEIVVTARFRAEKLQDVPVSVSAMGGEKLLDAGIAKISDLQSYVPNFTMSETGIGTNIYIRGIGSGINQGFEQSVGMYVDGIYYGRAQLSRAPFLDLQRVEVLRGPQNILYGKNSVAGAVSMITAKPGDEFEGLVSASYEPDHGEQVYDLVLSGPLSDQFGARFAYRNRSMDGWVKNLTLDRDEPELDEQTARLILDWQPTEAINVALKYEHSDFDSTGRNIEIINDQPAVGGRYAGQTYAQILTGRFAQNPTASNNRLDYKRSSTGDFSDNKTDNVTLSVDVALGDYTLTSITGWLSYEYDELCDCDFTGASLFTLRSQEEYDQFSQEFRFTSPVGQTIEYIAGAYFQTSELDFNDRFVVPPDSAVPAIIAEIAGPAIGPVAQGILTNLGAPRTFSQDTDLWSVFAQLTWNVTDALCFTFGGRYSSEDKDGARRLTFVDNITGAPITNPLAPLIFANVLRAEAHDLKDSRSESNFAPLLIAEYDLTDNVMVYVSATRGFKSGGYDARSNADPGGPEYRTPTGGIIVLDGAFEYDEEEATGYELGVKGVFAGGAAELNAAYFYTEYDDLQVSIFDGVLGFNVGNAAQAVSQGVELDGRWLVTEGLVLTGALAWLDFEFKDFPNGQCIQGQAPTTPGTVNCNYKGKTNQYVAEWSGTLSADYTLALTDALDLRATLDLIYSDDYSPAQNLDPRIQQDSYVKVNARLGLAGDDGQWEVALVGKNLTDEEIVSYGSDVPLAFNFFNTVAHYGLVEEPRTVALQGLYRF